jgi:hypothetical protein
MVWGAAGWSFVAFGLMVTGTSRLARADVVDVCVEAAASGQKLQHAGQLGAARTAFLACDKTECPSEVRAVCDGLLNRVEASMPSVIFVARDAAGNDLVGVRVRVDGTPVAESLEGKAVAIDPGPHTLRFEHAGDSSVEQDILIREAEKYRSVVVVFPAIAKASAAPRTPRSAGRRIPVLAVMLGGVGVGFMGAFAALDVDGQGRYDACRATPCSTSTVDSLSIERGLAWGALGIGVASLGIAAWIFLSRATSHATTKLSFSVLGATGTF